MTTMDVENPNTWMDMKIDDDHFHISGYINKQNFRFWSHVNPWQFHQQPLHSVKVTMWCVMSSFGIVGPYFLRMILKML